MGSKVEQRLQCRRDTVRELTVKGYNQRQIASILKIGLASVKEDLQYLRQKAKENFSKYLEEYLRAEYENCLDGLNNILTEAWTISTVAESDKGKNASVIIGKRMLCMKLDCYLMLPWLIEQ